MCVCVHYLCGISGLFFLYCNAHTRCALSNLPKTNSYCSKNEIMSCMMSSLILSSPLPHLHLHTHTHTHTHTPHNTHTCRGHDDTADEEGHTLRRCHTLLHDGGRAGYRLHSRTWGACSGPFVLGVRADVF